MQMRPVQLAIHGISKINSQSIALTTSALLGVALSNSALAYDPNAPIDGAASAYDDAYATDNTSPYANTADPYAPVADPYAPVADPYAPVADPYAQPAGTAPAAQIGSVPSGEQLQLRDLALKSFQPSYVAVDRAVGVLKALGYPVIEYQVQQTPSGQIYTPTVPQNAEPPVIVTLPDASKTSLMDPAANSTNNFVADAGGGVLGGSAVPDIGGTYLHGTTTGDAQQRMLIAYEPDKPETLQRVLDTINQHVDIAAPQIVIEALVIEVNKTKLRDVGITFDGQTGKWTGDFQRDSNDSQLPSIFNFSDALPDAVGQFQASIRALVTNGDAEVLSNPSVLVLDGRQARIQVGQQIPVTTSTATDSFVQAIVEYFPVGIVLNLRPRVSADQKEVSMQVETIVSAVNAQASASTDNVERAPVVDNRQVQTFVRVANNTPFIIGGLIASEDSTSTQGIPVLSKIPVLGRLFERRTKEKSKSEVIIVLTPHVVPRGDTKFSYTRPKDSKIFDSSDNQLYLDRYRVREQEVFDLTFLKETSTLSNAQTLAKLKLENDPSNEDPGTRTLATGGIPGEDILVRRMLWETIRTKNHASHVNPDKLVLFTRNSPEESPQFGFLKHLMATVGPNEALVLRYPPLADDRFEQPSALVSKVARDGKSYQELMKEHNHDGDFAIVLTQETGKTNKPMEWLQSAVALKQVIDLNNGVPMTIDGFYTGLQLIYPTENDLSHGFQLIGRRVAQYWYETQQYYPAFEEKLNSALDNLQPNSETSEGEPSKASKRRTGPRSRR